MQDKVLFCSFRLGTWKPLATEYLTPKQAAMGNNCCNDLRLLADCKLTRDEAQSICELEHTYCDDKERPAPIRDDAKKEVYATDWLVLQALAAKLKAVHEGAT